MKQINDIPVRRRPQSKDVHPGDAGPEESGMRARRQIWEMEPDVAPEAGEATPAPEPARPRSTPLILRQPTYDASPRPADAPAPTRRSEAGNVPASPPEPVSPVPPPPRPPAPPEPLQTQPHPVSRPVSRPRVAEPQAEPAHDAAPAPAAAQPSSMRQRSRPIMAPSEPAQAPPRPQGGGVNRAKTRILGFHSQDVAADPMAAAAAVDAGVSQAGQFPTGWLVIVEGPGLGASFSVAAGVSTIGRGSDQAISLDFGDQSVSRSAHASVAYDEEQRKFYIGHGGKSNVVRRNGAPVLATEELEDGDAIRIGKTTLRFVAFCGPDFSWDMTAGGDHD